MCQDVVHILPLKWQEVSHHIYLHQLKFTLTLIEPLRNILAAILFAYVHEFGR